MTDDGINAAIAEACPDRFRDEDGIWFFQYATDCWSQCHNNSICTDLNAMHEAEKVLTKEQVREYQCYMYDMACEIHTTNGKWMPYSATARYRAEAFLKTLGLWKEVQK